MKISIYEQKYVYGAIDAAVIHSIYQLFIEKKKQNPNTYFIIRFINV